MMADERRERFEFEQRVAAEARQDRRDSKMREREDTRDGASREHQGHMLRVQIVATALVALFATVVCVVLGALLG